MKKMTAAMTVAAGALALFAGVAPAAAQEDWRDPCHEVELNRELDPMMAAGYGRVCEMIGAVKVPEACMNYYLRISSGFAPASTEEKIVLAAACEAAMPGGAELGVCHDGEACPKPPVEVVEAAAEASEGGVFPCADGKDCPNAVLEAAAEAGQAAEAATDSPVAEAVVEALATEPTGEADEASVEAQEPMSVTPAEPKIAQPEIDVPTLAPSTEGEYWRAILSCNKAELFEDYLRAYPQGSYRSQAKARLAALSTTPRGVEVEPDWGYARILRERENDLSDRIHRDVQRELWRLGCYNDTLDGIWGPKSMEAMERYNEVTGAALEVRDPGQVDLRLLLLTRGWPCR